MKNARSGLIIGVLVTALLAVPLVTSALIGGGVSGGAATVTWYQCANAKGLVEAGRGGTAKPTCGNKTDPIWSWQVTVVPAPPPPTSTTKSPTSSSTTSAPSTSSSTTSSTTTTTVAPGNVWHPSSAASITWDWQLQGNISTTSPPQMFDIDGFDNTAATVAALHSHGTIAVCYMDVGTNEPNRPDQGMIPPADNGNPVQGFATERWLDVRDIAGLEPLIHERMGVCAGKGFDAVEPDDVDGYTNNSGFPLTANDQLAYNTMVASEAHAAGLSVALKNDVDQLAALEPHFDWALNEECNAFSECSGYSAFTGAGKAVFNAEYSGSTSTFCPADAAKHINGSKFAVALNGSNHSTCPAW